MKALRLLAALAIVGASASASRADIVATFNGTDPFTDVSMVALGSTYDVMPVGPFKFTVTTGDSLFGTGPLVSFCAALPEDIAGQSYSFQVVSPSALPDVGPNAAKLALIDRLFDRHYGVATDADRGGAFQLALWELLYDGPGNLDLNAGNHDVTSPDSVTAVAIAKNWLAALETPNPADVDNYTVYGLASPDAQDQLTVVPNTPNQIPAPAGVVLGLIAVGGFGLRRWRKAA